MKYFIFMSKYNIFSPTLTVNANLIQYGFVAVFLWILTNFINHIKITRFRNHLINYHYIFHHQNYLNLIYSLNMKYTLFVVISEYLLLFIVSNNCFMATITLFTIILFEKHLYFG
jgi:hypothetical protein